MEVRSKTTLTQLRAPRARRLAEEQDRIAAERDKVAAAGRQRLACEEELKVPARRCFSCGVELRTFDFRVW